MLLIPPEVEVLGKGARRAGEADVATVADDSRVVLENRGGAQLVAAADDIVADFLQGPRAVGEGDHFGVVVGVGRDDGLPCERPGD